MVTTRKERSHLRTEEKSLFFEKFYADIRHFAFLLMTVSSAKILCSANTQPSAKIV
jgi:hypothetical protein